MRVLFDQGAPVPLRHELTGHEVKTAFEMGWASLANGELLRAADAEFDVLITTDKNLRHQQNLDGLRVAILVLPTTNWPEIQRNAARVLHALAAVQPGELLEVSFAA